MQMERIWHSYSHLREVNSSHTEDIIEGPQDRGLPVFNKQLFARMQQLRWGLENIYVYEIYVDTAKHHISR